jgi:glycosyltransferase involved in cell wall biosynthesis
VFISSSRVETFGISPLEALACGLPVISTISGGPEQFVNNENGLLIEKENALALKDAMLLLYQNYYIYSLSEISRNIIDKYSKEIVTPILSELLIKNAV